MLPFDDPVYFCYEYCVPQISRVNESCSQLTVILHVPGKGPSFSLLAGGSSNAQNVPDLGLVFV